jgi:hypothetical protein
MIHDQFCRCHKCKPPLPSVWGSTPWAYRRNRRRARAALYVLAWAFVLFVAHLAGAL